MLQVTTAVDLPQPPAGCACVVHLPSKSVGLPQRAAYHSLPSLHPSASRPADEQPRQDAQEPLTDACSDACLGTVAAAVEELVCADSGNACQTETACW